MQLKNKTFFITGGTRGVGQAIAHRLAKEGANIVIAAKSKDPHAKLPGTLDSVVEEIHELGGRGLGVQTDVRFESQIHHAVDETVRHFGGIDGVINNAGAIQLTNTMNTPMSRFDLMMSVNVRASFATTQACIPHLRKSDNPHVVMLCPPISLNPKWLASHGAYTISKYGMSLCVIAMAHEFKEDGIAVNALWPSSTIATAAIQMIAGDPVMKTSRKAEIVGDALFEIIKKPTSETGNFFIDEDILKEAGYDVSVYNVVPGSRLTPDFFLDGGGV